MGGAGACPGPGSAVAAAGLLFGACAAIAEYPLVGTEHAPTADGIVEVQPLDGGNLLVTVSLDHLPPPERLDTSLTVYVMWFESDRQPAVKAGRVAYDPLTRQGRIMASTTLQSFTMAITAERDANVTDPGEVRVAACTISGE